MPTFLEIKYPWLTYCKRYDVHCSCPKCTVSEYCWPENEICKDCEEPSVGEIDEKGIISDNGYVGCKDAWLEEWDDE